MEEAEKTDLANCLLGKTPKARDDLLASAWEMENAKAKVDRESISRMQLIRQVGSNDCVDGCDGECTTQVLRQNSIPPYVFAEALRDLLTKGRGEFRNILLLGPTNCGKTFLLLPLDKIFKAFFNPANNKYVWIGAEESEIIFLNDFRWTPECCLKRARCTSQHPETTL